jgi:hypothetical protein
MMTSVLNVIQKKEGPGFLNIRQLREKVAVSVTPPMDLRIASF